MKKILGPAMLLMISFSGTQLAIADDVEPYIAPTATYVTANGEEESENYTGSAPLTGRFKANPQETNGWSAYYEWRFTLEGETTPYLIRYEEDTEVNFTKAGSHSIVLYAIFTKDDNRVEYTEEYWSTTPPLRVSISESKLEIPNAFSPNGDGINDIYKAKEGYQSLTEFHAYIFNRWGQKIYEWDDPAGGWDGTQNGKDVKQGVYFVLVKAKGADGREFNIRKDVNLLRGYTERTTNP